MRYFLFLLLFLNFKAECQNKLTATQKGWLVYRYGDLLAFLPLKDQTKTPTYDNFFTEDKGAGQRMNNSNSAPLKLLLSKTIMISTYQYDSKTNTDTLAGKFKYYIQPVKYVYEVESMENDTADYLAGGWTFMIKGKTTFYPVYDFNERSGEIQFLNKSDSLLAEKNRRRKTIEIYPPH